MDGNEQNNPSGSWQYNPGNDAPQPGSSFRPQILDPAQVTPPAAVDTPTPVAPVPMPPVTPVQVTTPVNNPAQTYDDPGAIAWTASEFVAHDKSRGWYGKLALVAVAASVLIWLITKDLVTSIVIIVAALMFGVYGAHQPRELMYRLDVAGLTIGQRYLPYETFKSFAILTEGAFASIVFTPHKRFLPLTTIYYDPQDEDRIVELLAQHLPLEERKRDAIDRLMWRIRF